MLHPENIISMGVRWRANEMQFFKTKRSMVKAMHRVQLINKKRIKDFMHGFISC